MQACHLVKDERLDRMFSLLIRGRDQRCTMCGAYGPLDCSHYIVRAHHLTRWWPVNAVAHCRQCHDYLGVHKSEHSDFMIHQIGADKYGLLVLTKHITFRWPAKDKAQLYAEMRQNLKELEAVEAGCFAGWFAPTLPTVENAVRDALAKSERLGV